VAITQNVPEYQVNVGVGAGDGFMDSDHFDIRSNIEGKI
jgi:hypothetical protein